MTARRTFQTLTADLGLGAPPPPDWRNLTDLPLLILVGVTKTHGDRNRNYSRCFSTTVRQM